MGYEITRFNDEVDEELMCTICGQVLESPVQIRQCEHCFCGSCVHEWFKHQQVCPVDRNPVSPVEDLIQPPRILRNLLSRLKISCDNKDFGCTTVVRLDSLGAHHNECLFNPKRPVPCDKGCGLVVPLDEVPKHNCVQELHKLLNEKSERVDELVSKVDNLELQLNDQYREILILKEIVRSMRTSVCGSLSNTDETEKAIQTVRWLSTLKSARVRRWGGMISTPDAVLQAIIKRALGDSGCPSHLLTELMANAHERRWPTGLSTLETRQMNRRRYEQYVTKRVPGKQAIVIMASENEHMGEAMIVSPGLVMIFAHGVE
ncbi:E3 ubiquitin-protein ligase NRDP1-like [Halichondria panicea]|uniref:E3 ubiquitin-protein ligase NRDP1-like n=1 Tax=Halichondria panicea TaxID=6063 RepID=UPI00312B654B